MLLFHQKYKKILTFFTIFVFINLFLYSSIVAFYTFIPFQSWNYFHNAHIYIHDPRAYHKSFNFLDSLAQYDAQWYLKIAEKGYPNHPKDIAMNDKNVMDGLMYAFFPLYPLSIALVHIFIGNIELAAFIATNIFLLLDFFSLYFVIKRFYSDNLAIKTIFLLFLFPFSIFYRSYFTESIYLFLLIWFAYFLIKKQFLASAIFLGLLNITKGNGLLLNFLLLFFLIKEWKSKKIPFLRVVIILCTLGLPFVLWMGFCYLQTGNLLYFYRVRSAWDVYTLPPLWNNFVLLLIFPLLPLHNFHISQIDIITVVICAYLLIKSKKSLQPILWWVMFILWINPLLVTDTMSYTRYQTTTFPFFLYVASLLQGREYKALLIVCAMGFLIVSLFFVNWYWIG